MSTECLQLRDGPELWRAEIRDGAGEHIATMTYVNSERAQNFGKLFVASPDLLKMCKAAKSWLREFIVQNDSADDPMQEGVVRLHNELVAAIAKAEHG